MAGELGLGKVTKEVFRRSVLPYIPLSAKLELDGATVEIEGRTVVAHSPSIGVPLKALGFFAFHYAASNVACRFGKPTYLITGIYLPLRTMEEDLATIAKELGNEAKHYGVEIVAGQTATYYGLEIPLVSTTCFGKATKAQRKPREGDAVIIVGKVGAEALWLSDLAKGISDERWREFTALPVITTLQQVRGIKLFHDVSEGGVAGALLEVLKGCGLSLKFPLSRVPFEKGVREPGKDQLRSPSYGTLVIVTEPSSEEEIRELCLSLKLPATLLGHLERGEGLVVDGEAITQQKRTEIDEIYGSFRSKDEVEETLSAALRQFEEMEDAASLIPEIGSNMVYAKLDAAGPADIAGLDGRIIVSEGKPKACGKVWYGGSQFLASVIVEALRRDPSIRAAVVIRGGEDISLALKEAGKTVVQLSPESTNGCPVARFLSCGGVLAGAYSHPGAFGIEPTTTILGRDPAELLKTLRGIAKHL
jgi:hydrogenase maturation factor/predicted fused transcriptional regulator/phosphomethylpyrimidine kinase